MTTAKYIKQLYLHYVINIQYMNLFLFCKVSNTKYNFKNTSENYILIIFYLKCNYNKLINANYNYRLYYIVKNSRFLIQKRTTLLEIQ